jgi:PHD/YefM family antitoxin component YafN of YafNO toxin-antitoxin module
MFSSLSLVFKVMALICVCLYVIIGVMIKTNALKIRQNLGAVIDQLLQNGEPILVEKGRQPVAVLIPIEEYKKRFVDVDADLQRRELVEKIRKAAIKLPPGKSSLDIVREIRS